MLYKEKVMKTWLLGVLCLPIANVCLAEPLQESGGVSEADASQKEETQTPAYLTQAQQGRVARDTLAKQLDMPSRDLSLVSIEPVVWASGALGCPKLGESYMQAHVSGTLIIWSAKGVQYRFHAVKGGKPFYCSNKRVQRPVDGVAEG